jgi:hypothetical protein
LPYWISATLSNWPLRCRSAIWARRWSISSFTWAATLDRGLLRLPDFLQVGVILLQLADFVLDEGQALLAEASSFSFFTASRSILSWIRRRSSLSITSGMESISILMRLAASSMRSMALSGRKRSVM